MIGSSTAALLIQKSTTPAGSSALSDVSPREPKNVRNGSIPGEPAGSLLSVELARLGRISQILQERIENAPHGYAALSQDLDKAWAVVHAHGYMLSERVRHAAAKGKLGAQLELALAPLADVSTAASASKIRELFYEVERGLDKVAVFWAQSVQNAEHKREYAVREAKEGHHSANGYLGGNLAVEVVRASFDKPVAELTKERDKVEEALTSARQLLGAKKEQVLRALSEASESIA